MNNSDTTGENLLLQLSLPEIETLMRNILVKICECDSGFNPEAAIKLKFAEGSELREVMDYIRRFVNDLIEAWDSKQETNQKPS